MTSPRARTVYHPDQWHHILYSVYLRNADGHKYVNPQNGNEAAREERTTPLLVEPPDTWTGGPREPQPRPLG